MPSLAAHWRDRVRRRPAPTVLVNDQYLRHPGLSLRAVYTRRFEKLIGYPARRGEYGPETCSWWHNAPQLAPQVRTHRFERAARDGRTLLVDGYPLALADASLALSPTYTGHHRTAPQRRPVGAPAPGAQDHSGQLLAPFPLFDGSLRMAACNAQLKKMLNSPTELIDRPVVYFEDLIRFALHAANTALAVPEEQVATAPSARATSSPTTSSAPAPTASHSEIISAPIPVVDLLRLMDITERTGRGAHPQHGPATPRPALPNRISINERIDQALWHGSSAPNAVCAACFWIWTGFKSKPTTAWATTWVMPILSGVAERSRQPSAKTDTVARAWATNL